MFLNILPKPRRLVFNKLANLPITSGFYLAGGTAVAIYLGHRESLDFDFFSGALFDPALKLQQVSEIGEITVISESYGTLNVLVDGIKVSFFYYKYPLLFNIQIESGVEIADLRDIGLMKIAAITGRGSKKDFIDLYQICREVIPLEELLQLFEKKYAGIHYNRYHLAKSLCYFNDADGEPELRMIKTLDWGEVKRFFLNNRAVLERWVLS